METTFNFGREGYVLNWLTAGPRVTPFEAGFTDRNQLEFERRAREVLPRRVIETPETAYLGENSQIGDVWLSLIHI